MSGAARKRRVSAAMIWRSGSCPLLPQLGVGAAGCHGATHGPAGSVAVKWAGFLATDQIPLWPLFISLGFRMFADVTGSILGSDGFMPPAIHAELRLLVGFHRFFFSHPSAISRTAGQMSGAARKRRVSAVMIWRSVILVSFSSFYPCLAGGKRLDGKHHARPCW